MAKRDGRLPVEKLSVGEVRLSCVSPARGADVERRDSGRRRRTSLIDGTDEGDGLPLVAAQSSADQPDGVAHERAGVQRSASRRHRDQSDRILGQSLDGWDGPAQSTHHVLGDEPRVAFQEPVVLIGHLKDIPSQDGAASQTTQHRHPCASAASVLGGGIKSSPVLRTASTQ